MYIYIRTYIYIFIMNVYRSNCEASTMKERKRFFFSRFFFFGNLLCDEHLCVLGELSRPHNHVVHGRMTPALAALRGSPFSKE